MEKDKTTKQIWIGVIIVVVIGLIFISQKSNKKESVNSGANEPTKETSATAPGGQTTTVKTTTTTTSVKKPMVSIVQLTDTQGFKPFLVEIKRGDSVEFLNNSNKAMVIRSNDTPPENFYPGFSQSGAPLGKGGKFIFAFTTPGAWSYYNLNSKNDVGVIIVK